jgi:bla regulator protein blaR1
MTTHSFSSLWSALTPAIANHVWQSTLVAFAAAMLTLLLRKHSARIRYWLWLAASLKFLVPFSLLVSLGTRLSWSHAPSATPSLYFAIEQMGRPFMDTGVTVGTTHVSTHASWSIPHLSTVFSCVWLLGFFAVLLLWTVRWLRISASIRKAVPMFEGREVEALRRAELVSRIQQPIPLLLSRTSLEPGVFGIFHPVLLWPEGISQRLDDANLEAVVAHEVWHVCRRDNLFAAMHMLVEAVFWFYPLVWWLGARLIDERERACDEEVVAIGKDRQTYAESILKVCEFCLGSPLPCVSGVTGADLKKRMVHIMNDRTLHRLGFARKLLLTAAAFLAVAVPITFGVFHATPGQAQSQAAASVTPMFESVSIKPSQPVEHGIFSKLMFSLQDGTFTARGVTLQRLIHMAYRVQEAELTGGPEWVNTQTFDIDAKLNSAITAELRKQIPNQPTFNDQAALRSLLADRFKLTLHPETRNIAVYDLVVADGGPKLQESNTQHMVRLERGEMTASGAPISLLADELSQALGQTVVDKTGLTKNYAFSLHWTPDTNEDARFHAAEKAMGVTPPPSTDPNAPPLSTALEQQLGLKLEQRTDVAQRVLVIDHAEAPGEQ